MTPDLDGAIDAVLDALERREARLLSWGIVDGGFTADEVAHVMDDLLPVAGDTEPALVNEQLLERNLLFEFRHAGQKAYRTRSAEAIRLLARLRQILPWNTWRTAPTLVADYRYSLVPRSYPRRDWSADKVVEHLEEAGVLSSARRGAVQALLKSDDGEFLLSGFQVRATHRLLQSLDHGIRRGMIVCAGTGTGKTLAFYLPALAYISELVASDHAHWTKCVAIYPRNELLKDQFAEAYRQARRLDAHMVSQGRRKIRIGAFYGATPNGVSEQQVQYKNWPSTSFGFVCPYLRCPNCDGPLVWSFDDLAIEKERLSCHQRGCSATVTEDEVALSRTSMATEPPDLLFTSTEMLNRQISDSRYRHVFGVGTLRSPELLLLDEVHTYSSTHGAQVSYLLRRWQHAVGNRRVQFAGLSATLVNPTEFFASLCGLFPSQVHEIAPFADELVQQGMEYCVALRGDPVSATSLLSTSIQSIMLLRRVLDPRDRDVSHGLFGKKIFVFTDNLDVTNRLYHDLLDAEALRDSGQRQPGRIPLAAYRSMNQPENAQRFPAGQSWMLAEEIGHGIGLRTSLRIGRTSSQDTGVDPDLDVIVATASLEVGFDDPLVGATIQHKAPLDAASALQRRGRAGRPRNMRPWTVVVLSDYGRDRLAYQAYDLLFSPLLSMRALPVSNRYVVRIQAVFAFLDWIAQELGGKVSHGSPWQDFSGPSRAHSGARWAQDIASRQSAAAEIIRRLLVGSDPALTQSFERYIQSALSVSSEELRAVLWEPPRPLMLSVLPTLLRRLDTNWQLAGPTAGGQQVDYHIRSHPLPDFVPAQLFGDLNLPEVAVHLPPPPNQKTTVVFPMPVRQAMEVFAPGRATRRFGLRSGVTHWIPPRLLEPGEQPLPIPEYCAESEAIEPVQFEEDGQIKEVPCYRPWGLRPVQIPNEVLPSSNSQLEWRSQISHSDDGLSVYLPDCAWNAIVKEVRFFTQNRHSHVGIRRFAMTASANIKFRGGRELETRLLLTTPDGRTEASLGFSYEVDGIVFRYSIPKDFRISPDEPNQAKLRAFRTSYFRHRVLTDDRLAGVNVFQRDWLFQIYLSALCATALEKQLSLMETHELLVAEPFGEVAEAVLDSLFQRLDAGPNENGEGEEGTPQRVSRALLGMCRDPAIAEALHDLARSLWVSPDEEWERWARQRFQATLGAALHEACQRLCPEFGEGELVLDVGGGIRPPGSTPPPDGLDEIWITESTLGGGGIVEEVLRQYLTDPRRFYRLADSALDRSDFEVVDCELTRMLNLAETDSQLASRLAAVRRAEGNADLYEAVQALRQAASSRGILCTHPVMTALNARVLRPGSSEATDALLLALLRRWTIEEERLGVELDARVFAYVASADDEIAAAMDLIDKPVAGDKRVWRYHTIYGLLWPRGFAVRARGLRPYNPFHTLVETDREVVLDLVGEDLPDIRLDSTDWRATAVRTLADNGVCRLSAPNEDVLTLKREVLTLLAQPIDMGFLQSYAHVEAVDRSSSHMSVTLAVRGFGP